MSFCLCAFSDYGRQFFVVSGDSEEHSGRDSYHRTHCLLTPSVLLMCAFKGVDCVFLLIVDFGFVQNCNSFENMYRLEFTFDLWVGIHL